MGKNSEKFKFLFEFAKISARYHDVEIVERRTETAALCIVLHRSKVSKVYDARVTYSHESRVKSYEVLGCDTDRKSVV